MYRLLIVDDENQIREGLKKIINWEEYGIQVCGEASEGRSALEMIKRWQPQIVLTDMKMPGMDGISLLKEIKSSMPGIKVIVLSGYNDFSLVRQAMKYGAVDYLLKPTGKKELIQVIEELLDQFEETQKTGAIMQEGIGIARNHFFNRLITNNMTAMEFHEKSEFLDIDLGKDKLAAACLGRRGKSFEREAARQENLKIAEICREYLEKRRIGTAFFNSSGEVTILLKEIKQYKKNDIYKEQLENLLNILEKEFSTELFLSVSKVVKSYRNLAAAYEEAEDTSKYIFIFEKARILYAEEIDEYFRVNDVQTVILQEKIEELLQSGNEEHMEKYLEDVLGNSRSILKDADYYVLRNMAMEVLIYFFHFLMVQMSADRVRINEEKTAALQRLSEIETLERMKKYLNEVFVDVSQQYKKYKMLPYSKLIGEVMQKIKEKYADADLSLQYLSEELNVNTAYLGRLFKKEIGISFVDYLNWYRVEKAETLLKETSLKGSELCGKVGFANYNYFYVVFKKLKGKKPTEVRGN